MQSPLQILLITALAILAGSALYASTQQFNVSDYLSEERLIQTKVDFPIKREITITESRGPDYTVDIRIPETGHSSIDKDIREYVQALRSDLNLSFAQAEPLGPNQDLPPHSLGLDFRLYESQAQRLVTIVLSGHIYTGGAHDLPVIETWTYDRATGAHIRFPELFSDPDEAVGELATLVIPKVQAHLGVGSDDGWIGDGAGAQWSNYTRFIVRDEGVEVIFPPYQVAAYAVGTVYINLSYAELNNLLKRKFKVGRSDLKDE